MTVPESRDVTGSYSGAKKKPAAAVLEVKTPTTATPFPIELNHGRRVYLWALPTSVPQLHNSTAGSEIPTGANIILRPKLWLMAP